jgi:hypothetical protein
MGAPFRRNYLFCAKISNCQAVLEIKIQRRSSRTIRRFFALIKKSTITFLSAVMLFFSVSQALAIDLGGFKGLFGLEWGDSMETVLKKTYNMGWTPDVNALKGKWGNVPELNFSGKIYNDAKARVSAVFDSDDKTLSMLDMTFAKRSIYNDFKDSLKQYGEVGGYKGRPGWTKARKWSVGSSSVIMGIITKTHEVEIIYGRDSDLQ